MVAVSEPKSYATGAITETQHRGGNARQSAQNHVINRYRERATSTNSTKAGSRAPLPFKYSGITPQPQLSAIKAPFCLLPVA
jgi:hypothetical protein